MGGSIKARISALLVALGLAACGGGGGGGSAAGPTAPAIQPYTAIAGLYQGFTESVTGQPGVDQVFDLTGGELHVHPDGTVAGQLYRSAQDPVGGWDIA